jgi:hypothetical protein
MVVSGVRERDTGHGAQDVEDPKIRRDARVPDTHISGSARNRSLPSAMRRTDGHTRVQRVALLDHPVADVDRAGSLEHAHQLELQLSRLEAVEKPLPRAEDHRGHLEVDLVDQPGPEGLLGA